MGGGREERGREEKGNLGGFDSTESSMQKRSQHVAAALPLPLS